MTDESNEGKAPGANAEKPKAPATEKERVAAKPAAAKPAPKKAPARRRPAKKGADPAEVRRRNFVWTMVFTSLGAMLVWTLRFFFPRVLFEPSTRFKIGSPADYALGVDTKWQQAKRIWVVRQPGKMFVIFARCTHLGCTPDWKETDHKFKCPCHGSGFDSEGVNFEGPAPQPLLRTQVAIDTRGQIVVDKAKLFPVDRWDDPEAFILV